MSDLCAVLPNLAMFQLSQEIRGKMKNKVIFPNYLLFKKNTLGKMYEWHFTTKMENE
jgi:hypothetical protein